MGCLFTKLFAQEAVNKCLKWQTAMTTQLEWYCKVLRLPNPMLKLQQLIASLEVSEKTKSLIAPGVGDEAHI